MINVKNFSNQYNEKLKKQRGSKTNGEIILTLAFQKFYGIKNFTGFN